MFYEELDCIKFDYDQLLADVQKYVFPLGAQVVQGEEYETPAYHGFGGWSITSRRGTWKDGWDFFQNDDGEAMETYFPNNSNNYKTLKFFDIAMSMEHKNPTEACQGSIADLVKQIEALGLYPRRVRVTCLKAGAKSLVHKDANDDEYMARIHIPLITNPSCVFISNGIDLWMEPRKAYMVWVNDWHQIRNDSLEDRYHIIMDAYDTRGITKNFKYNADIQELIDHSNRVRDSIEAAELTQEEWDRFEALRQTFVTQPKHPDPVKDSV